MRRRLAILLSIALVYACSSGDTVVEGGDQGDGGASGTSGHPGFTTGTGGSAGATQPTQGTGGAATQGAGGSSAGGKGGAATHGAGGASGTQGTGGSAFGQGGATTQQGAGGAPATQGQGPVVGQGGSATQGQGPGAGGNPACDPAAGSACYTCCDGMFPNGSALYAKVLGQCACGGACMASCNQDCSSGMLQSQACADCLNHDFANGQCSFAACASDAQCAGLSGCYDACAGGGAGGTSSQGAGGTGAGAGPQGAGGSSTAGLDCPGDGGDPLAPARIECVKTINMYRATLNLPPYARWCGQAACTDAEPKKDRASGTAHSAFGMCGEWAQNECPGWPNSPLANIDGCLQLMWNEGPGSDFQAHGHFINMSSTMYTMVECGFDETSDWWGVQDFK